MDHQPRVELEKLLISLLTEADVRRIVRLLPGGEEMHAELPGTSVSLKELVHQAVSVLERHGRLDRAFFEVLVAERPARRDEIRALAARMPGTAPAVLRSPDIIDFTGERARHQHFFGRQDILRELDDWLWGRDSGWLLLTGSPGLGKSAIFNHWLGVREQAGSPTAFHFIRRGIHNWADPSVVRASLAAQIERDFSEQKDAEADPQLRLEQLLHRISPVLEQRQQQLVLLVDGLDETMTLGGADNPIPRILPHELPWRVFVFVASRPLYPHLHWFTRRTGHLLTIDLDGRPGNLETVRAFWTALRGTLSPPPADDLVRTAIERSEGNLLHAVKLHQLWSQRGARRTTEAIPQGFVGMLSDLWERLGNLPEEQWEIARLGLSLLCAARQALPLGVIDELLEWGAGKARHKLLPLVREFLHEEHWHKQTAFRPFHEGVRELIEHELPETLREHHRRLASFAAWPSSGNEFRCNYALRHRVVHQVAGGQNEDAAASCRDVGYLTEKACALGVLEVEREIRLAARVQKLMVRKHLSTLAMAVGACSHWAREAPGALPALLHDRLLSYAPAVHGELVWPPHLRQSGPLLRYPLQTGGLARVLVGHEQEVHAVAVLSDSYVVSGSEDETLRIWDVATGQSLATLKGHQGWITALAVLPDGRLVSGSTDKTLRIWDRLSGQSLATLKGHHGSVNAVAVLPDGRIVSASNDKTLRVWDAESGQTLVTRKGHHGSVNAVAVLPDGRFVSGSNDKTLRIWEVQSGRALATLKGHRSQVRAVAVLPDGHVVSASDDNTVRVWDAARGQALANLKAHRCDALTVAALPDGCLVSGCWNNTVRILDVESGQVLATLKGHQGPVRAVAVLPDGRVVSSSDDNTLRVWDVMLGQVLPTLESHQSKVRIVAVLPDGRIVSASDDNTLIVWDVTTGRALTTVKGHEDDFNAVTVLSNGRVVSTSDDGTSLVWDISTGQALATLEGHSNGVAAVAVLPDGCIVSASYDTTLRVWDVATGRALATLEGHEDYVIAVAVLPDGRVISGSEDHTMRIWDIASGQALATLKGHQGWVMAVAALPNGRVVSGSGDHTVRVWDIASGKALATLKGHQGWVVAVAVLPDGRVVSASYDNTLRIWDIESGQALAVVYGDASFCGVAAISQHLIVAGDAVGNVWFIDLP